MLDSPKLHIIKTLSKLIKINLVQHIYSDSHWHMITGGIFDLVSNPTTHHWITQHFQLFKIQKFCCKGNYSIVSFYIFECIVLAGWIDWTMLDVMTWVSALSSLYSFSNITPPSPCSWLHSIHQVSSTQWTLFTLQFSPELLRRH